MSLLNRARAHQHEPLPTSEPAPLKETSPAFIPLEPVAPVYMQQHPERLHSRKAKWTTYLLGFALMSACVVFLLHAQARSVQHKHFITVDGTKFMEGCRPFYITGFNVDSIIEAAISSVSRRESAGKPSGRQMVQNAMQQAAAAGFNTIRVFAHTSDAAHPLLIQPGSYSDEVFQALDYVVAQAEVHGLRVILSLLDNWRYRGGVDEIVDWSNTAPEREAGYPPLIFFGDATPDMFTADRQEYEAKRHALFYTDKSSKNIYKNHISAIVHRKNSVTGKKYKDDATIMSFNLLNEPRCDVHTVASCPAAVQQWVEEMSSYFKSIDSHHLLTIGGEGFWGPTELNQQHNPGAAGGSSWGAETGQSFILNHECKDLDYASIHSWPDNFNITDPVFHTTWLEQHAHDAEHRLYKPLLLEEFGKKLTPPVYETDSAQFRNPIFDTIFTAVEKSAGTGGALAGSLFWELEFTIYDQSPMSPYAISPVSSTFKLASEHAQRMRGHMLSQPANGDASGAQEKCGNGGCWVGRQQLGGLIRRCVDEPRVCGDLRDHAQYVASWDGEKGRLNEEAHGVQVFGSHIECCRTGLGGFGERGCSMFG